MLNIIDEYLLMFSSHDGIYVYKVMLLFHVYYCTNVILVYK